jgi:hypothetical protein
MVFYADNILLVPLPHRCLGRWTLHCRRNTKRQIDCGTVANITYFRLLVSQYDSSYQASIRDGLFPAELNARALLPGHQLVLRYSLEHTTPGDVEPAAALGQNTAQIRFVFSSWIKQQVKIKHRALGYILDGIYIVDLDGGDNLLQLLRQGIPPFVGTSASLA